MCALKRRRVRAPFDGTAPLSPVTICGPPPRHVPTPADRSRLPRIGGTSNYTSPRGCTGDFVVLADATATLLDGTFTGADCRQGLGRVVFDGVVHLTKR